MESTDHSSVYSFLSDEELHKIQEDNKLLIEVAKPLSYLFRINNVNRI